MPTKVMILAQFDHGYYIRGTLKRLMDVLAWLKAWWILFGHGYHIRGTLERLMGVLVWLKTRWISARVKQDLEETDRCCGLAQGLVDVSEYETSHRPEIHATVALLDGKCLYYIHGTLKRLTDVVAWLQAWWICLFWLGSGLPGFKVLNTWCRCLEFYTILALKSPALR
ncbi:hypothetical protein C8R44DRAFT_747138 [Mycena epipterygia]|nr:hypothetical protein C8R44DRAFT_747138 [Mycena epipterygia]